MEKVVYCVWKPAGRSDQAFADALRERLVPQLRERGARWLKLCVVDDAVAPGARLRLGRMDPPVAGLLSFWLEQSQEVAACEAAIRDAVARLAGYLVVESRPIVNTTQLAAPGARTPGFSLVSCIVPHPDLGYAEFLDRWYRVQRDTAIETQSTFSYVRNEIVRPLTPGAPAWAAVVEEGFPLGALTDPMLFYDAPGDREKFERNAARMQQSCQGFLAMDQVESHPMSEYVFERFA